MIFFYPDPNHAGQVTLDQDLDPTCQVFTDPDPGPNPDLASDLDPQHCIYLSIIYSQNTLPVTIPSHQPFQLFNTAQFY